jgi:tetratricopeptide (TPR) repeat protein
MMRAGPARRNRMGWAPGWPLPRGTCYALEVTTSVARVVRVIPILAAAVALLAPVAGGTPVPEPGAPGGEGAALSSPAPRAASSEVAGALRHYLSGRLLEERGVDVDALEEYRRALQLDPNQPHIELRMSVIAGRLGQAERSLDYARRVLEREPDNALALWLSGGALLGLGRTRDAMAALRAAAAADSDNAEYWRTLARAAEQSDQIELVAECWRHVVRLEERDGEAWFQLAAAEARLGQFGRADSALAESRLRSPVRPGALFLDGWIQESLGRREQAIALYRRHLEFHPEDQTSRRRLVNLLVSAERFREAYDEARIVGRANPDNPEAISVEADLALRLGDVARADELLERLLRGDPDDPARIARVAGLLIQRGRGREAATRAEAWATGHEKDYRGHLLVARVRSETGDAEGAILAARRAAEMAGDSLGPRFILGRLLQAGGRYAAAESVWTDLVRRSPAATGAVLDLAYCRERQGNVDGAVSAVRDVLAREPDNPVVLNFLGYLFADHNRNLSEAEELIRRALAQDPDNGAYVDSMGWVYYRLGRLAEARQELERAVRLTGGDPVVREHLGDVYRDLGLFELAREQYRESLGRDEGNARVRAKLGEIR